MRVQVSRNSEVPLRGQLVAQIILQITSGELKAAQKLPSVRELARRLKIHSNTVSAAYRDLQKRGWVRSIRGSGVYVRDLNEVPSIDSRNALDQLISTFLELARQRGFPLADIRSRVRLWLESRPPNHFLVVEPDPELRDILVAEIEEATAFPTLGTSVDDCRNPVLLSQSFPVVLYGWADEVRAVLPAESPCLVLRTRSALADVQKLSGGPKAGPVRVLSRCAAFRDLARSLLVSAGLDPAELVLRDGNPAHVITSSVGGPTVCDTLVFRTLPRRAPIFVFRVIADSSLSELKAFVEWCRTA